MGGDPHNLIGAKMIRSQDGRRGNELSEGLSRLHENKDKGFLMSEKR